MTSQKRRSPGEGGAYPYPTARGEQWYWKAAITLADGSRKTKVRRGFRTRALALKDMRAVLAKSETGTYVEPSKRLLSAWLLEWVKGPWGSPNTAATYEMIVEQYLIPVLGATPVASLTRTQIRQALARLRESGGAGGRPLSVRTVAHCHSVLHGALKAAVDEGMITASPAERIRLERPRKGDTRPKAWTPDQLRIFLDWAREHDPSHYALYYTTVMCGLRVSEACALRWYQVGVSHLSLTHTKGDKPATVDLSPAIRDVLRSHRQQRAAVSLALARPDAAVFGDASGNPVSRKAASGAFSRAVARCQAGLDSDVLPALSIHGLRHTMASLWLDAGEPVKIVSERLRHSSPSITYDIYSHIIPGSQADAARRMDDRCWGADVSMTYQNGVKWPLTCGAVIWPRYARAG